MTIEGDIVGRIIIFTGKGGVGKTSVAAAHALNSASEGRNTLLVSTDMAHNLGDIFQVKSGKEIVRVTERLDILELDPDWLMKQEFPNINRALGLLFGKKGVSITSLDDNFIIPGFENLFSLLKIRDLYNSGAYDRIIVDCAPTGETLSLLKLPELLAWYLEKFFPVGKFMIRVFSPVSKLKYKVTLPDRKAMNEIEQMHGQLLLLQDLLRDPDICSIRLVGIPERMVVEETKRNYMYMNLYGYQVDGVFINRILPEDTGNDFMNHWHQIQKQYIEELERVFYDIPITRIIWYPEEVRGVNAIDKMRWEALDIPDLFEVRVHTETEVYTETENGYMLTMHLPGIEASRVKVAKNGLDMDITVNHYNRCLPLPNTLRSAEIKKVIAKEETLQILFDLGEKDGKDYER